MSQENVEVARAAMEDFIAGKTEFDADGALTRMAGEEHWHPDIELDVSEAVVPEMRGVFRGKEAVRRWWGEWLGAWETAQSRRLDRYVQGSSLDEILPPGEDRRDRYEATRRQCLC